VSTNTFTTTVEICIGGHACEREATVRYEISAASGDGWHEPRYEAGATVCEVETVILGAGLREHRIDLLPLLTKEVISALEADCLRHEDDERQCRASEYAEWKRETEWEAL
jgi:hypothetical protein